MKFISVAVFAAFLMLIFASIPAQALTLNMITVNDPALGGTIDRSYWLEDKISSCSLGRHKMIVVALHGAGGNGQQFQADTTLDQRGRCGLFVFPNGTKQNLFGQIVTDRGTWNSGRNPPEVWAEEHNVADVAFLRAVIANVRTRFPAFTPDGVYVTGFSNGARMTYRMGCEALPDEFQAIGPHAAPLSLDPCLPPDMPVQHTHGLADPINPWDGGGGDPPSIDGITLFAQSNGCTGSVVKYQETSKLQRWRFTGCPAGLEIEWTLFKGVNHDWPTTASKDASEEKLKFFEAH